MNTNRKLTLAAIPLAIAVTVSAVALGSRAGAQTSEASAAPTVAAGDLLAVTDQQDLQTGADGRVVLDLKNGELTQACLSDRIDAFLVQNARNNDPAGRFAVSVQAVENTECTVKLRFFDKDNQPLGDQNLRIAYVATTQDTVVAGEGGAGVPGPQGPAGPAGPEGPQGEPGDAAALTSPAAVAAVVAGLSDSVLKGLGCDAFATQEVAQAAFDATGGAAGPLGHLDGPDSGALACDTDDEGTPT